MDATSGQAVQQSGRRTGQCFALAGLHFGHVPRGQDGCCNQLDIVQLDLVHATQRFDHQGKRVDLHRLWVRTFCGDAATQRCGAFVQLRIGKRCKMSCRITHQARHFGHRSRRGPQFWPPYLRSQA
jgi:hypothetical protein